MHTPQSIRWCQLLNATSSNILFKYLYLRCDTQHLTNLTQIRTSVRILTRSKQINIITVKSRFIISIKFIFPHNDLEVANLPFQQSPISQEEKYRGKTALNKLHSISQKKLAVTVYLILLIHTTGFSQFFFTTECLEKKKKSDICYAYLHWRECEVLCQNCKQSLRKPKKKIIEPPNCI